MHDGVTLGHWERENPHCWGILIFDTICTPSGNGCYPVSSLIINGKWAWTFLFPAVMSAKTLMLSLCLSPVFDLNTHVWERWLAELFNSVLGWVPFQFLKAGSCLLLTASSIFLSALMHSHVFCFSLLGTVRLCLYKLCNCCVLCLFRISLF